MIFHFAVMLLATTIFATPGAALQRSRLNSPELDNEGGSGRKHKLESHGENEERHGGGAAALVPSNLKELALNSRPRILDKVQVGNQKPSAETRAALRLAKANALGVFKHQPWVSWVGFALMRKKRVAFVSSMTKRYGDRLMASKIIALKSVENKLIKRLAITLQVTQVHIWRKLNISPDDVFRFLQLDEVAQRKPTETTWEDEAVSLFNNAEFGTWTYYVRGIHGDDDQKAEVTMVRTLTTFYGDDRLAKIITTAKHLEDTMDLAGHLREAQLTYWLRTNAGPTQVLRWMRVKEQVMDKKEVDRLEQYIRSYANLNPG